GPRDPQRSRDARRARHRHNTSISRPESNRGLPWLYRRRAYARSATRTTAIATATQVTSRGVSPEGTRPRYSASRTRSASASTLATRRADDDRGRVDAGLNTGSVVAVPQR